MWCTGTAHTAPLSFNNTLMNAMSVCRLSEVEAGSGVYDCWAHFTPGWTGTLYITFFTVAIYIIPFILLVLLYGRICFEVWRNGRHRKGGHVGFDSSPPDGRVVYKFNGTGTISVISTNSAPASPQPPLMDSTSASCHVLMTSQHHVTSGATGSETNAMIPRSHSLRGFSRSKLKTIKLTFVVIVVYVICWSPFFITQMWWAYDPSAPYNSKYTFFQFHRHLPLTGGSRLIRTNNRNSFELS